ncbi:hypothetical protein [Lewinella cohaerens]|uniref:hypothetical protein n=1 Tax=Lewinella cohaerens TaxID=70995 RepID=UPI000382C3D8|nr:hypothetical protein [Lewinella cohaerens]
MKLILQIAFVFVPVLSIAQDYIDYYSSINDAKRRVLEGEYDTALVIYKQTFETFEFEYARDCVNAAEVAAFLNEHESTNYFLECSLRIGVPLTFFEEKEKYEEFRKTDYWIQLVVASAMLHREYLGAIDSTLRAEINEMFREDQSIRSSYYKWWNFLWRPLIAKKWKALNKRQVNRLVEITKEQGFPGEKLIGIDVEEYHPKIDGNQCSAGMPIVILLHHYSQPNASHYSLFKEQIALGNLLNQHYATVSDFEAKYGKGQYANDGFYGVGLPLDGDTSEVEVKRAQIGLLDEKEMRNLNQQEVLTKFWNRLY